MSKEKKMTKAPLSRGQLMVQLYSANFCVNYTATVIDMACKFRVTCMISILYFTPNLRYSKLTSHINYCIPTPRALTRIQKLPVQNVQFLTILPVLFLSLPL